MVYLFVFFGMLCQLVWLINAGLCGMEFNARKNRGANQDDIWFRANALNSTQGAMRQTSGAYHPSK